MHILERLETTDHFQLNNSWRAVVDNNVSISFMFYLQRAYMLSIMHLCLKWKLIPEQSMAANFSHRLHLTTFIAFFWKLLRNNLVARRRKVNTSVRYTFGVFLHLERMLWAFFSLHCPEHLNQSIYCFFSGVQEVEYLKKLWACMSGLGNVGCVLFHLNEWFAKHCVGQTHASLHPCCI